LTGEALNDVHQRYLRRRGELVVAVARAQVAQEEAHAAGRMTSAEFERAAKKILGTRATGAPPPPNMRAASAAMCERERSEQVVTRTAASEQQYRADGVPIPMGTQGYLKATRERGAR
jgi:hypothetical protein